MYRYYYFVLLIAGFFLLTQPVHGATKFNLVQPNSQVNRGDIIKFTITVDTQGLQLPTSAVGVAYNSNDLQFVSVERGNTFTEIVSSTTPSQTQGTANIIVTGNSNPGFNGAGDFAYINFKLIATSAGSTQLCSLFTPEPITPTLAPSPTALPETGSSQMTFLPVLAAVPIIGIAIFTLLKTQT